MKGFDSLGLDSATLDSQRTCLHNLFLIGMVDTAISHIVPYLVVVKIGKPSERSRPGNRDKRDSQMVIMHFLNKVGILMEIWPMA